MIKVENIEPWGFEHAVRGMRNPMNSWDKSDSGYQILGENWYHTTPTQDWPSQYFVIGNNDLDLMKRLYKAGTEHRKYLRQIFVSMDITAPLYWWKEFDTYKFVVPDPGHIDVNSCSTMHKIAAKEFDINDFSHEHVEDVEGDIYNTIYGAWTYILNALNYARDKYLKTKDKTYWWQMIQLFPSSYNQRRTVTMNYENVVTMIKQRTGHKLDEWNNFVDVLKKLPYIKEITE